MVWLPEPRSASLKQPITFVRRTCFWRQCFLLLVPILKAGANPGADCGHIEFVLLAIISAKSSSGSFEEIVRQIARMVSSVDKPLFYPNRRQLLTAVSGHRRCGIAMWYDCELP
jgi:hypothetical protein